MPIIPVVELENVHQLDLSKEKTNQTEKQEKPTQVNNQLYFNKSAKENKSDLKYFFNESGIFADLFNDTEQEKGNLLHFVSIGFNFLILILIIIVLAVK